QIAAAFQRAVLAFGGVDLIVNNAGLSISKSLLETSVHDWDLQHDVMARGSFLVSRESARILIDQAMGGDLVYIVSKNAFFAGPNNVAYGASKADQAHQVRLLAAELGQYGIRVNGVNPDGVVRGSGIFAKGWGADRARTYGISEDKLGEFYAQRTLLKREVLPEHVAAAVFALRAAATAADPSGGLVSIGVDSWGVDHVLLDERGALLSDPVHYRDERTTAVVPAVHRTIPPADLYARTGIQHLPFNTIYQLAADQALMPAFAAARTMLLIPDLFAFWLSDVA